MRGERKMIVLRAALAAALSFVAVSGVLRAADLEPARLDAQYGRLELSFEANWGQADPAVQFLARGAGYGLLLTPTEVILSLSRAAQSEEAAERRVPRRGQRESALVRVRLAGANGAAQILGEGLLPGKANYFSGQDPAGWITEIPTYRKVRAEGVYPGVDLVYYGNQRELEFDFVVAPGANPDSIRLAYEGVDDLRVEAGGDLVLRTKLGEIRQHSPSVYQEEDGQLKRIPASHVLLGSGEVGFRVRDYDRARPLVIDPRLSYSTLLGGTLLEGAASIAVDSSGNAYVTGITISTNFPVLSPYQSSHGPGIDTFVTKLNPTGTALVYSTYLHGNDGDTLGGTIAVDSSGSAYVAGGTSSYTFPTTSRAFQSTTSDSCCTDGFITKLSPAGSQLVFSTYIAGSQDDIVIALKVGATGAVYAVGDTESGGSFPTRSGSFQTISGGGLEAFALQLDPTGGTLAYSTFLGGSGGEEGMGVALDSAGNAYVAGWTDSTVFPTTTGAYQRTGGGKDAFVAKLNSAGSALLYSSRFGGRGDDPSLSLTIDGQGNAYVVGRSTSADFPFTAGAFQTAFKGVEDAFVLKLNPAGSAPVYATLIGGAGVDKAWGVTVDSSGNACVAGQTQSADFPRSADAIQAALAGTKDGFVTKVNPQGSALPFSTYLGGSGDDSIYGLAMDADGLVYVTGDTGSTNFPTTTGAYQTAIRGTMDAFIAKLEITTQTQPVLSIVSGNNQTGTVGTALPAPLIVELRSGGAPVAGATVTFSGSGATLNPASVATGADGRASTVVTPTASGTVTITAATPGTTSVIFTATVQATSPSVTFTSAASFRGGALAPGMIAVAWGQGFTTGLNIAPANVLPLPTTLGGVSVTVRDSAGIERVSSLWFTSATQINFYLAPETQGGQATVRINCQDGRVQTATVNIESVNPGLFSLNGDGAGIVAGNGIRVRGTEVTYFQIFRYDSAQSKFVGQPIDFGLPTDRIFLELYGTGFRNRTSLANVNVTIGGTQVAAAYMAAVSGAVGLDQLNVELPRATAGRGDVPIVVTVDGKTANTVTVNVAAVTPAPTLTSVNPNTARAGDTVNLVLTGTTLSGAQIEFNSPAGLTLSNVNATSTQVTATLVIDPSAATGARTVTVSTPYGRSNSLQFTVTPPPIPTISQLTPNTWYVGLTTSLRIDGSNLAGATGVEFTPADGITVTNVTPAAASVTAQIAIAANAPKGERTLAVLYTGGRTNALPFTVSAVPWPNITSISPTSARAGDTVSLTLRGTFLTGSQIKFEPPDGLTASNVNATSTQVTATLRIDGTAAPGARNVSVFNNEGPSNTLQLTITPPPVPSISLLTPNSAYAGESISLRITGTNLAYVTGVELSPSDGITVTNLTPTASSLTAQVAIALTAAVGQRTVTVVNTGGRSNALTFTVNATPLPVLTSVTPTSARAGDTVSLTLRGTGLSGSQIEFQPPDGLTLSNVNSTSSTQLTATLKVDGTAATGPRTVKVTTSLGSSNTLTFTIDAAPVPSISSLSPTSADVGTTFTLTISGSNLAAVTSLEFTPPDGITVENITPTAYTVTARITIDAGATPGERRVAVVSPGGKSGTRTLTINAVVDPTFVISNLRVGPATNSYSGAEVPVTVDFVDPQGASVTGDTRMNFNVSNGGITGWTQPVTVSGTTSGTMSMRLSLYGIRFNTGVDIPIRISMERPAGVRRSNSLSGTFRVQ